MLGLAVIILSLALILRAAERSFAAEFGISAGGALIGFASSAFFSRQDQFLVSGCRDLVYLISNRPLWPSVYELRDRESINALGGTWHAIIHVSERVVGLLSRVFGRGRLSLKDAVLYRVPGEKSVFSVILNTRYGIPDPETLNRIWGENIHVKSVQVTDLDRRVPERDFVSVQYWPKNDRATRESQHLSA